MAAEEESAGFVIFRAPQSAAPPAGRDYLLLDYGRHWDYPKGHVEKGESPPQAALRELREETGIEDARVIPGFARQIVYFFRDRKKGLVRKKVTLYLAETKAEHINLSREHQAFAFEPYESALQKLTFPSARQVLMKAEEFLTAQVGSPHPSAASPPRDPSFPR